MQIVRVADCIISNWILELVFETAFCFCVYVSVFCFAFGENTYKISFGIPWGITARERQILILDSQQHSQIFDVYDS